MPQKTRLKVLEAKIDMGLLSHALAVKKDEVTRAFMDGRVASPWAESWGAKLSGMTKSLNSNEQSFDMTYTLGGAEIAISNKCLTGSGVRVQESRFVGSGRRCSKQDLISSLASVDLVQIVDITDIPNIRVFNIHSRVLIQEVHDGNLTPTGWSKKKFYEFIERAYDVTYVKASLYSSGPDSPLPSHAGAISGVSTPAGACKNHRRPLAVASS